MTLRLRPTCDVRAELSWFMELNECTSINFGLSSFGPCGSGLIKLVDLLVIPLDRVMTSQVCLVSLYLVH